VNRAGHHSRLERTRARGRAMAGRLRRRVAIAATG